jgi:parallel beta-helix repeat protein
VTYSSAMNGGPKTTAGPAAFFSYVHRDDEHDGGQIRRLRDLLEGEVRMQLGDASFAIFVDRADIAWGQNWRKRIDSSLAAVTLLIPVITPAFFASDECRHELDLFLAHERDLARDDLILPIYYVSAPNLDVPARREHDSLARQLGERQRADWRDLRFEPFTSPVVRQRLSQLASRMRDSFWRMSLDSEAQLAPPETVDRAAAEPGVAGDTVGQRAPTRRNEPPTLVVDPWGHGDHSTIGAAIDAADPGTRILVRSGLYEEGLVIDKPLEIVGQGPVQDVIVRARGCDALLFKANIGRVSNLTLHYAGTGPFFGVDISQGRLELEDCDIVSECLAGIGVHDGADPRVRRNRIHDGQQGGVFVYEQGLGTFEDNDVFANALAGFEVKEGGNPTVRRNRIHDGQQGGVYVWGHGLGTFEDNDVFANAQAQVSVKEGGNPTVRRNRIHDGQQGGVYVWGHGLGTFEDNDVFANAQAGVTVKEGGNPTVRRNRINGNGYEGVWVYDGGHGRFEDNDLTDNARGAWDIDDDCDEHVVRRDNQE